MAAEPTAQPGLKPLKITCTSSNCTSNLHCFLVTKKLAAEGRKGRCRDCDADLEWTGNGYLVVTCRTFSTRSKPFILR
jgi:hypothetical protein